MSAVQQSANAAIESSGRALIEHLNCLVTMQDLGALALLRHGLRRQPEEVPEMYAHVLPYLKGDERTREREEEPALLVASLYALWHQGKARPISAQQVSLGAAFRQLANSSDSDSIERRFVALLKASRDRLPDHLRHAISLLKAKEISLDWARLFSDLSKWDETDRRSRHPVRARWSRDYWERTTTQENDAGDVASVEARGGDDGE